MKIETKFSCGDSVRDISRTPTQTWVPCDFCGGTGSIKGANGSDRYCPECNARKGTTVHGHLAWELADRLTIGQVQVRFTAKSEGYGSIFSNFGPQKEETEIRYMAYETGIGSGTLHNEANLFATDSEAEAECAKRNAK